MKTIEVCNNNEYLRQRIDAESWTEMQEEAASEYAGQLHVELESRGFVTECAKGQRSLYHGWKGFNLWQFEDNDVGSFDSLTDEEATSVYEAKEAALKEAKRIWEHHYDA
tara:strand:+ start:452 stop:781 length:330 start_codon:yes stop_codon:yes gene_type:complete